MVFCSAKRRAIRHIHNVTYFIVKYKLGKFKHTHWHSYINLPSLMGKWLAYVLDSWLLAAQTECYWAYWLAVWNKNVEDSAQ